MVTRSCNRLKLGNQVAQVCYLAKTSNKLPQVLMVAGSRNQIEACHLNEMAGFFLTTGHAQHSGLQL